MKAKLQPISNKNDQPIGPPVEVQFNPNSLRLSLANQTDAGTSAGRQRAQHLGTGSATMSVELVFDTADQGTTEAPRSVLDLTTPIEQMLLPQGPDKQSPARMRFEWGQFVLTGIVESMSLDLELFSDNGVPLRAKINLSIQQQRTEFEFLRAGPGANRPGNVVTPGRAGLGAVGGSFGGSIRLGASAGVRTTLALAGESAADLAARVGVDPAAWRSIADAQGGTSLSLPAGASVDFDAGVSADVGLGARSGALARTPASLEEAFGLAGAPGAGGTAGAPPPDAGFTLSAAGGVQAALGAVDSGRAGAAADGARRAFAGSLATSPAAPTSPRPERPEQPRAPLYLTGLPSSSEEAPPAPTPPRADSRAVSFGLGVPLRARVAPAADDRIAALGGAVRLRAAAAVVAPDPTRPSWEAPLGAAPVSPRTRTATRAGNAPCRCGCSGGARS
jgi:Contractile injection system tube protein